MSLSKFLIAYRIPNTADAVAGGIAARLIAGPEVERLTVQRPLAAAVFALDHAQCAIRFG